MDVVQMCTFGFGILIGYFGVDFVTKALLSSSGAQNSALMEEASNKTLDSSLNKYQEKNYIQIERKDEKNYGYKESDSRNQNNDWEGPDSGGSNADREYLSKLLHNKTYTKEELAANIEDNLHLVKESDLVDGGDDETLDRSEVIVGVSAVEFVKAIAAGYAIKSFIFNPIDKTLRWNFTDMFIDDEVALVLIGKQNLDEIRNESDFNANGWIQPRYYHDVEEDVYIKVETGFVPNA